MLRGRHHGSLERAARILGRDAARGRLRRKKPFAGFGLPSCEGPERARSGKTDTSALALIGICAAGNVANPRFLRFSHCARARSPWWARFLWLGGAPPFPVWFGRRLAPVAQGPRPGRRLGKAGAG